MTRFIMTAALLSEGDYRLWVQARGYVNGRPALLRTGDHRKFAVLCVRPIGTR